MELKDALVMINSELKTRESERLEQIFETIKAPLIIALTMAPLLYGAYYINESFGILSALAALALIIYKIGTSLDDLKSKELNETIRSLKQLQYQLKMGVNVFEKVSPENFKSHVYNIKKK